MANPSKTIAVTFSITVIGGIVGTILVMVFIPDVGEASFGAFFGGIFWTALILLLECIILAIVYRKLKRPALMLLSPPVFIVAILLYHAVSEKLEDAKIDAPPSGKLPVSIQEYQADTAFVGAAERLDTVYQHQMLKWYRDTIVSVQVDTVYFSKDLNTSLSTISLKIKNQNLEYQPDFQFGYKQGNSWLLRRSGIWLTDFNSDSELRHDVKRYLFKNFSINGSSSRPDIWKDGNTPRD